MEERRLVVAMVVFYLVLIGAAAIAVLTGAIDASLPKFSATISGYDGLVRSSSAAAAPPSFRVALRVKNTNYLWQHCFEARRAAVVEYEGVPLASADLDAFCVPARTVLEVPVVATSEGLGIPDQLYESLEGRRERQERVPLEVRLVLEEKNTLNKALKSLLLRCTAMLDGRATDLPSPCMVSFLVEPGRIDGE
ncbi:unnamed protein product [Alopecurus aequalis]